jgi:hypothetical protein
MGLLNNGFVSSWQLPAAYNEQLPRPAAMLNDSLLSTRNLAKCRPPHGLVRRWRLYSETSMLPVAAPGWGRLAVPQPWPSPISSCSQRQDNGCCEQLPGASEAFEGEPDSIQLCRQTIVLPTTSLAITVCNSTSITPPGEQVLGQKHRNWQFSTTDTAGCSVHTS